MKGATSLLLWALAGLACVASFAIDWANTAQGGAVDLRNRITGIRLLEHGIDPYHYKWRPGDPDGYCDPLDRPARLVTRTTVTPALLVMYLPWAPVPYRVGQYLWLVVQWMMLLGTGWLWYRSSGTTWAKALTVLIVIGFSFTAEWRLHTERGQCYVPLTFFFACWLTMTLDPRRGNGFTAGFFAGALVALRPPFALLVPFLAWHRRGQLLGAATGIVLGFRVPMLMVPACWRDYLSATQTFSDLYRHNIHPPAGPPIYPAVLEGVPLDVMAHSLYLPSGNFSLHGLLLQHGLEPFPSSLPILALGAAFIVWLWLARDQAATHLLPGMAAWLFLADLFLPVSREGYDDVLILNVILAGLAVAQRIPWAAWPCLLALPLAVAVYARNLDHPWVLLPSALFTLSSILFLGFGRFSPAFSPAFGTLDKLQKVAASD